MLWRVSRSIMLSTGAIAGLVAVWAIRKRRAYRLSGRTALVTGGSRGLGLLIARELARRGARVAICARNEEELQRAVAKFAAEGYHVDYFCCDVTQQVQVDEMIRTLTSRVGPVDVLVNNAGIIQVGPIEEMTFNDYREAMDTHFWAPLYTIAAVVPQMQQRHEGRIVNIASIGGKISLPHLLPYSASKFALVGLSEGLRAELAKDGIAVTTVCPGLMRTGSPRNALFKGRHRAEYAWFSIADSIPLVSVPAQRAARRIVRACCQGRGEHAVSLMSRLAITLHGIAPGLTATLLGVVNRCLPGPGGIDGHAILGSQSTSRWAPSVLTILTERAARRNNELP